LKVNNQYSIVNRQSSIINPKGFTLIEIIIFIVIVGIILPVILIPFSTGVKENLTSEKIAKATCLAQYKMEELTKNIYDSVQIETQSYTGITGFADYQWLWDVAWIDDTLNSSAGDVGYKLILVRVKDPDNREIEMQVIVTRRPVDS
jgi:prepilin-type N-terminal cleavage/methylation domain-containing protein